jgi:hypothetical protein
MKKRFWQWVANNLAPKELLYFCVIKVWAKASTEKYTNKQPDEITWSDACKYLGVN